MKNLPNRRGTLGRQKAAKPNGGHLGDKKPGSSREDPWLTKTCQTQGGTLVLHNIQNPRGTLGDENTRNPRGLTMFITKHNAM